MMCLCLKYKNESEGVHEIPRTFLGSSWTPESPRFSCNRSNCASNALQSYRLMVYSVQDLLSVTTQYGEWKLTLCNIAITAQQEVDKPQTFLLYIAQFLQELVLQLAHILEKNSSDQLQGVLTTTVTARVKTVMHLNEINKLLSILCI